MDFEHRYTVRVEWTGNRGTGTSGHRDYSRDHTISADGNPTVEASADRPFRGDPARWNPEKLLVAALSDCHMLSYLHVAVGRGIMVTAYEDEATGLLVQTGDGGGHFESVTLHPIVTIASGDPEVALAIHEEASRLCFIAASVNFPVLHEPQLRVAS